jgi:DNA replication initiation complex subunit (GINS family)
MSPLTTKAQSLKFESKIPWSTARRPIKPRKAQEGYLEEGKPQKPTKGKKSVEAKENGKEEQENLKLKANTQNQHPPEINSP